MVVDGEVEVFPAGPAALALAGAVAGDAMTRPFEAPELLDVDVDQVTRPLALVAAHRLGPVQGRDAVEAETLQDAADGSGRDAQIPGDLPTGEALSAQGLDGHHRGGRGGTMQGVRPRRAVP